MTSKLTDLAEEKKQAGHKTMSKDAVSWLQKKIDEIKRPSAIPNTIKGEVSRNKQPGQLRIGMLYCYYYDPKTKDDLPYWDRFPMVLILEKYNDGFLGLNLHYLPVRYRVAFLQKLMKYAQLTPEQDIRRMRISYDILQSTRRFAEFRPCLKRYLYSHLRSRILMIEPNEWDVATMLPIQQFRGAKPQKVWMDSVKEYKEHMAHFNQDNE
jgi:hypothetical protein